MPVMYHTLVILENQRYARNSPACLIALTLKIQTNQYYEYIRIDMIVNQDKLFSIHVTMLRTVWTQKEKN